MAITANPQPPENRPRILVAGCGALGGAIASALLPAADVFGLRRNPDRVPPGVHGIGADLRQPDQLRDALPADLDIIIYCLTPSSYDVQGYRDAYVAGLQNLLAALHGKPTSRLLFISSTSVYHQDDDSWVDELSPTRPVKFSGQQILAGEQLALNSGIPATIVRFSGIYGPTRRRFLDAVRRGEMNPASPGPYSNRIHEADAVAAVAHLTERALDGRPLDNCYVVSDCEPVRLDEVVEWVRQQVPCSAPAAGARTAGRAGSKQCRNRRLLDTGFRFRYPDYRAGYGEMIRRQSGPA